MPIWNREDETEWEKYQRTRGKQERRTPEIREAEDPPSGEAKRPLVERLLERVKPPEEPPAPPEVCPWCGGEMVRGYLRGDRGIYWAERKPGLFGDTEGVQVDTEGSFFSYRTSWHCPACRKLVLDTAALDPPLGPLHPPQTPPQEEEHQEE